MNLSEVTSYHQAIYDALLGYLDMIKQAQGAPNQAALQRCQAGITAGLVMRDELRKYIAQDEQPTQPTLLDMPQRKGGY